MIKVFRALVSRDITAFSERLIKFNLKKIQGRNIFV